MRRGWLPKQGREYTGIPRGSPLRRLNKVAPRHIVALGNKGGFLFSPPCAVRENASNKEKNV